MKTDWADKIRLIRQIMNASSIGKPSLYTVVAFTTKYRISNEPVKKAALSPQYNIYIIKMIAR